jgi:glycosyltransferase involved in cell wall biosynthesis
MRVAFLTPEHPSEFPDSGGLATYVHRMARSLLDVGHEPEVFVPSTRPSETSTYEGVLLHRVNVKRNHPILRYLSAASKRIIRNEPWRGLVEWTLQAKALSAALEKRHKLARFELVQSADFLATGLLVHHRPGRLHVVRCSWAADLVTEADRTRGARERCQHYLEKLAMRRADLVYAPSRYVATYLERTHKLNVHVLRPPAYFEATVLPPLSFPLPSRFFLHFGALSEHKGTPLLAAALPIAWREAPDLTMVWSGRCLDESKLQEWRSSWGEQIDQVRITGSLNRPEMYAVLERADAAVLPSQVDNLPNTVTESLMFGVPVLGSRGASIDELVEEGRTGHLVELGNVHALAEALVMMWLKQSPVSKGFQWRSQIAEEMRPERAVANLIDLVTSAKRKHPAKAAG